MSMTIAPISSTIVALALIPVAFLFCHAFLSGRHKNRFHPISGAVAIIWGSILVDWLHDVPHFRRRGRQFNFDTNTYFKRIFRCSHRNGCIGYVSGACCSRYWILPTQGKGSQHLASKTDKNSFLCLVVRFSIRRNLLHSYVCVMRRLLSSFICILLPVLSINAPYTLAS